MKGWFVRHAWCRACCVSIVQHALGGGKGHARAPRSEEAMWMAAEPARAFPRPMEPPLLPPPATEPVTKMVSLYNTLAVKLMDAKNYDNALTLLRKARRGGRGGRILWVCMGGSSGGAHICSGKPGTTAPPSPRQQSA